MSHRRIAVVLTVVAVSVCAFGLPAHADRLYWSATTGDAYFNSWLASVRTDGSGLVELYEMPGDATWAPQVGVDSGSRRLYWIEEYFPEDGAALVRGDTDGCQSLQLEYFSESMALDVTGGKIYWIENTYGPRLNLIKRANLDFSSVELLLEGLTAEKLEVDPPRGKIYWYDGFEDTIIRSNLDGSNVETVFEVAHLSQLQIDSAGQKIYWAQWSPTQGFKRADLDGSNVEKLAPQVQRPFTVDVNAGVVYWRTGGGMIETPRIRRANLDGSNDVIVLEDHVAEAQFLVLDPSNEVIALGCGIDVPALGFPGAVALVLLILTSGTAAVLRSSI